MSDKDLQKNWQRGEQLARQGQFGQALLAYENVLAIDPVHVMALLRASRVALAMGQYRNAREYVLRALQCSASTSTDALLVLARALRMFNESQALLQCVNHSGWSERGSAAWLTEVAMLVSTTGENALALRMLDRAVARDPGHPPARYLRGVVHMFFGNMDAAERDLEHCIAQAPAYAQAHWVLSRLRTQTADSHHVDRIRAQLSNARKGGNDEIYLSFALHNELHDLGRYEEAWRALEYGCRCKRRKVPHDLSGARRMFQGLSSLCTEEFVRPSDSMENAGEASFTPIFIVGMHRSGSTLLEQLLGGHPRVTDGGESYAFTAQMRLAADYLSKGVLDAELVARARDLDYAAIGHSYLQANAWRADGASHLTEKLPSNFLNLGFIAKALPRARILHMVRDPRDTCFSNLRTMFSDVNAYSYDQRELAEWFGQYRRLMAHWHTVMPDRILDVHYGELVDDPEAVMRRVLEFCGLAWSPAAATLGNASAVATASSPQMRSGIIRGRKAAWAPYEQWLQPLFGALEDLPVAGSRLSESAGVD